MTKLKTNDWRNFLNFVLNFSANYNKLLEHKFQEHSSTKYCINTFSSNKGRFTKAVLTGDDVDKCNFRFLHHFTYLCTSYLLKMTQFANVKHHFKFNLLMWLRFGSYHPDILLMVKFMVAIVNTLMLLGTRRIV